VRTLAEAALECLAASGVDEKLRASAAAASAWRAGALRLEWPEGVQPPTAPAQPERPRLVSPRSVPRRRLNSHAGRTAFVHALAHIEFNAIGLAWDCAARFSGLPHAFYDDWVAVAADETRHFEMLRCRLRDLGAEYGDFDAHGGLWEMAAKTAHDLLARMAMVPRVLEARALDVTPGMIVRLRAAGDDATAAILEVILEEEVAHVAAGSRWFRFECERRGLAPEPTFRQLFREHWTGAPPPVLNRAHRLRAGFTEAELASES
jgi:uncharacterized ferritin-like protein (DUF455 family)